jgi:hypothetical protein
MQDERPTRQAFDMPRKSIGALADGHAIRSYGPGSLFESREEDSGVKGGNSRLDHAVWLQAWRFTQHY